MYHNKEEFKLVADWREVWWHMDEDREYFGSPTGTVVSHLERRFIMSPYGKQVHISDDGELEMIRRDSEPFTAWFRCKVCGKEILATL